MKGAYRALGIVTALALVGVALTLVLGYARFITQTSFLLPTPQHVEWIGIVHYYRSFSVYATERIAASCYTVWAVFVVVVAAQTRRVRWLAAFLALDMIWISITPLYPAIRTVFAVHSAGALFTISLLDWGALIGAQIVTYVFIASRPRATSRPSPAIATPTEVARQ